MAESMEVKKYRQCVTRQLCAMYGEDSQNWAKNIIEDNVMRYKAWRYDCEHFIHSDEDSERGIVEHPEACGTPGIPCLSEVEINKLKRQSGILGSLIREKEVQELTAACQVVMQLLREHGNPHMTVVIDQRQAKVVSDEMGLLFKEPVD